jgi:hypothetical protein
LTASRAVIPFPRKPGAASVFAKRVFAMYPRPGIRAFFFNKENRQDRAGRIIHRHDQVKTGTLPQRGVLRAS